MQVAPPKNNLYNSPKIQCAEYTAPADGSKYFARFGIPSKNAETRRTVRQRLLDAIPLYTVGTFLDAPDGVYTWIMGDRGFFATPVFSVFEHGTLHLNLTDRTGTGLVVSAGEARKTGSQLKFNLLSGTYTRHILEDKNDIEAAETAMETEMTTFFGSIGFTDVGVTNNKTYITGLPTESELKMYAAAGYAVDLYRTKDACVGTKRALTRQRIDLLSRQLGQPAFASPAIQEKLGAEKAKLEAELAALESNIPVRMTGGRRRRTLREHRSKRRRTLRK